MPRKPPAISTFSTRGSRMPSGKLPRTRSTAFLTSATASFGSVPISNSTKVLENPSLADEVILFTPLTDRTALSTCWVIWFSISVGAAPGWEIPTVTAGNSTSGLLTTSILTKLRIPASSNAVNATSGRTGLRIDHAERLRKFIEPAPYSFSGRGLTVSPSLRKPPARRTIFSVPLIPLSMTTPSLVTWPGTIATRSTWFSAFTT